MWKLHHTVALLLQDGAPPNEILQQWQMIYSNSSTCFHYLACYAIHHNHRELVDVLLQEPFYREELSRSCTVSPLITAVYHNDAELCMKLGETWFFYMDAAAFGIINGNDEMSEAHVTALDIIMSNDNAELMVLLISDCYTGFLATFLIMAKQFNAFLCYICIATRILLTYNPQEYMYYLQHSTDTDLQIVPWTPWPHMQHYSKQEELSDICVDQLGNLMDYMCCESGSITKLQAQSICHWWVRLDMPNRNIDFRPAVDETLVKQIASGSQNMFEIFANHLQPVDEVLHQIRNAEHLTEEQRRSCKAFVISTYPYCPSSPYTSVVLQLFSFLMPKTDQILIPKHLLMACLWKPYCIYYHCSLRHGDTITTEHINSLMTLNLMSVIFLCRHIYTCPVACNTERSITCDFLPIQETEIVKTYMLIFKHTVHDPPGTYEYEIYRHIHKHLKILLAYGYADLTEMRAEDFFGFSATHVRNTVHIIVSLLPHSNYEAYRLTVISKKKEHQEEADKDIEQWDYDKLQQLEADITNSYDVEGTRSLQELCRVKLYEYYGRDLMWTILSPQCEISLQLKDFVTLGQRDFFNVCNREHDMISVV